MDHASVDRPPAARLGHRSRRVRLDGRRRPRAAGPGADIRQVDLLELELEAPADAVLSTATFHWIADHARLFAQLHKALRPGGRLLAQCGGEGNIDVLRGVANAVLEREPYVSHFVDWRPPWNAGPEITRERLLGAGFTSAECWLAPAPQEPEHPREFLATIVLGPHVQHLPPELRDPFMDTVLAELGEPVVVDYVRLNNRRRRVGRSPGRLAGRLQRVARFAAWPLAVALPDRRVQERRRDDRGGRGGRARAAAPARSPARRRTPRPVRLCEM